MTRDSPENPMPGTAQFHDVDLSEVGIIEGAVALAVAPFAMLSLWLMERHLKNSDGVRFRDA